MSQRILLIESDAGFADEVRNQFESLGATVAVEGDGPSGLAAAESERPDLILLTIELPGMNGFLVCKKIKKNAGLKDVPLMILSSGATEEVFEQHKKLRTRADDYMTKPVAFDDLRRRVEQFVKLNGHSNGSAVAKADDAHDANDDLIVLESERPAGREPEVEKFADEAFESLVDEPAIKRAELEPKAPTKSKGKAKEAAKANGGKQPVGSADSGVSAEALEHLKREVDESDARLKAAQSDAGAQQKAADARIQELEKQLADSKKGAENARAEVQQARSAVEDEKRARRAAEDQVAASQRAVADAAQGAPSSRELLDLREQLNKKDRELIDLRDQVSARDKQIIEASDRTLVLERKLADVTDQSSERAREVERLTGQVKTLSEEKNEATRKGVELQGRAERAEQLVTQLEEQLETEKNEYADAQAATAASHAGQLDEMREQHAEAFALAKQTAEDERKALESAHAGKLAEVNAQAEKTVMAAKAKAEQELKAALEQSAVTAADEKETALSELRKELEDDAEARVSALAASHKAELDAQLEQVRLQLQAELSSAKAAHQQEMTRVGRALNDAQSRVASLSERLEQAEGENTELRSSTVQLAAERDDKIGELNVTRAELNALRERFARDAALLERVRKAMAIGMGLLEEQQRD